VLAVRSRYSCHTTITLAPDITCPNRECTFSRGRQFFIVGTMALEGQEEGICVGELSVVCYQSLCNLLMLCKVCDSVVICYIVFFPLHLTASS
jgi:hypothetical protein